MKKGFHSKFYLYKKILSKYKNIWLNQKGYKFRPMIFKPWLKRKKSNFGKLLQSKQKLKFFYCNVKEIAFKKRLIAAIKSPLKTVDKFLSTMEKRLDIILFRTSFVFSLYQAKQLISHGHVIINNKIIYNLNKKISQFDLIKLDLSKNKVLKEIFAKFENKIVEKTLPLHLETSFKNFTICFLWSPCFQELYFPIENDFTMITRFYR